MALNTKVDAAGEKKKGRRRSKETALLEAEARTSEVKVEGPNVAIRRAARKRAQWLANAVARSTAPTTT